jgi:integrase
MSATQLDLPPRPFLKLWSEEAAPDETLRGLPDIGRIGHPANLADGEWTLRKVLDRLKKDWPNSRKPLTWGQYETLLRYWEKHFGPGPCVSQVTPADLQGFFEGVEEWGTRRSWEKNLVMLMALLKSCCRASHTNKDGLPREIVAPLTIDDLPYLSIPSDDWFKRNRTPRKHQQGGHTPKRRSTLTLDRFQLVIDASWNMGLKDPVWWETMFAWIWFSGMRITQARTELRWSIDAESEGIHLDSASIVTTDSKCGGVINVPLPDCLMPGLTDLWLRRKSVGQDFVFLQRGLMSEAPFYAAWSRIWEHAIPCASDDERELYHFNPHELRSVSTTNWDLRPSPDDKAGWLVTGHSPGDVRTGAYFVPGDARLRAIVNRFPMPVLHCPRRLF